jgi:hypothetical protein
VTRITRKFNYTKRVRIPASKIHIEVTRREDGEPAAVLHRIDLSDSGAHPIDQWKNATLIVEARRLRTGSYWREVVGTVDRMLTQSEPISFDLPEFGDEADITFRVKVVDTSKRLLGEADGIGVGHSHPSNHSELIQLVPTDLGEEVWKVDWSETAGPRVLVNKRLPNCSSLLTHDALTRALVLPEIVREVLRRAADSEQTDGWVEDWLSFASRLGHEAPGADEDIDDWVQDVVRSYCGSTKFATGVMKQLKVRESRVAE